MANRHLSRSIVLQALFEWDFKEYPDKSMPEILKRITEEFGPGHEDGPFISSLSLRIIKNRGVIDEVIEKAAPDWPLDKINAVDRNILRIGLAELLYGDHKEVPPKVAINEAIELGKTFGGDSSGRFINGVLGAVYKEMGEPGKDQVSKKKNKKISEPIDIDKLPIEKKGGVLLYSEEGGQIYLGLVHDVFGYWTLSKGGIDDAKEEKEGVKREIREELGIEVELKEKLGDTEYIASHPEKGKIRKQVVFYLAKAPHEDLKIINQSGGLDGAKWFSISEVADLKIYDDIIPLIAKAIKIITKKKV